MIDLKHAITAGLTLAACSTLTVSCGGGTTRSSSSCSSSTTMLKTHTSTPVQSGFGQDEDFCAQRPLDGTIKYRASNGNVTMDVEVKGLPRKSLVVIDWANNTVRGYQVGSIATDTNGASIPSSLNLFRPGETRGYKIVLTTTANDATTLGILWPCGPPHFVSTAVVTDPRVTVTPSTDLNGGQGVNVSVSGFGESGKVFLSECDHAEDANVLGCGPQLAAQPFIITGTDRSGSATFVVSVSAASKPYDTTSVEPCMALCVIVATQGDGAWAVAPIAFGSNQLGPNGGESTTVTTAASTSPTCTNSQVTVTDSGGGAGLGHEDQILLFTNNSSAACSWC